MRQLLLTHTEAELYAVVLSLCDPTMRYKVSNHEDNDKIKLTKDTLSLLKIIKHLMYWE